MEKKVFYRSYYPFVRLLTAYLAGIGIAYFFTPVPWIYRAICIACGVSMSCFTLPMIIATPVCRKLYPFYGVLVFATLTFGGWMMVWKNHPVIDLKHFANGDEDAFIGYIADEPKANGKIIRFPLKISVGVSGKDLREKRGTLLVTLHQMGNNTQTSWQYGDEIIIPAIFEETPPPYNPNEMDYKAYLEYKNIWHQAYLRADEVQKTGKHRGNKIVAAAFSFRKEMVDKLARYIKDEDALAVASALLLGYRVDLDKSLLHAYSVTGTIHVLSVSGMHVAIIFWLLSQLLYRVGPRLKWMRLLLLLGFIWAYAMLSGLSPSVLRAAFMLSLVMISFSFNRQAQLLNSVAASAFCLLLFNPAFALDIGFQLSYLAVLGMVYFYPLMRKLMQTKRRSIQLLFDSIAVSVSAQLGAFPLAMYYFHQFPVYFLPANLFVILPVTLMMWLGLLLLIVPWEWCCERLGTILEQLILWMNKGIYFLEDMPFSTIDGIWLNNWEYIFIILCITGIIAAWFYRKKYAVVTVLICLGVLGLSTAVKKIGGYQYRELCVFNMRSDFAIGIYTNNRAVIYSNLPSVDHRNIVYSVLPKTTIYATVNRTHFVQEDKTLRLDDLLIRDHIIQFGRKRLMVYDAGKKVIYQDRMAVDVLLLRNNPDLPLISIVRQVNCRQLVADASNSPATLQRLERESAVLGMPLYILKDNFAYVWKF